MLKKYLLFLLLLGLVNISFSQNVQRAMDSLTYILPPTKYDTVSINVYTRLLDVAKEDTSKVNAYNILSKRLWVLGSFSYAMYNANKALILSKKINFKKGIANAYNNFGVINVEQANYSEALRNYQVALKMREEIGDKQAASDTYIDIGNSCLEQGNYAEALKNYLAALKIGEEINNNRIIANAYGSIGIVYTEQGNYQDALKNHFTSLEVREKINDINGMLLSHLNIGNIYSLQGSYAEALKNFFDSEHIAENMDDRRNMFNAYGLIGYVYFKQGSYTDAIKYYLMALKLEEQMGAKYNIADTYISLGRVYTKTRGENDANDYLQKGLRLAKENGNKDEIKEAYHALSQLDSLTGNMTSAYEHYRLYAEMKDSIVNNESNKQISQLRIQYETEKKNKEIEIKNISIEKQKATIRFLITGFIILSIFALIYFRLYNQKKKASFKHQVLETEMKALRSQMNPHFTFNVLNSIQYYVGGNDMKSVELYLNKFSSLIRMILDQSRNAYISLEQELKMLKLYLELEEMLFEKKFNYKIEIEEGINTGKTLIPGMLIQPIIENSIKHGIAHKKGGAMITISISAYRSTLRCLVKDNGIGRTAAEKLKTGASHKSVAGDIIKERIEALSSLYNIHLSYKTEDLFNSEGKPEGTCVSIEIPFKNLKAEMVNN